jgi:S1-C subfamily serine protease
MLFFRISICLIFGLLNVVSIAHQEKDNLKAAVVRIENNRTKEIGSGFIIKIAGGNVYVVTASHIVRGDQSPKIFTLSDQFDAFSATVLDAEPDDVKGLALLRMKIDAASSSKLNQLSFASTSTLGNGQNVQFIGFPEGTSLWTTDRGSITRLEGRNLVLSGGIQEGNPGGLNNHADMDGLNVYDHMEGQNDKIVAS